MSAAAGGPADRPVPTDPRLVDPLPVEPLAGPIDAVVRLPGSKSITNRALVCAALADGTSELEGLLRADDTDAMLGCLTDLGVAIEVDAAGETARVTPGPARSASWSGTILDARLSGTTARFVAPLLSLGPQPVLLDGAPPLRARPMGDGFEALRTLGAQVDEMGEPGHLPARISAPVRRGDEPGEVTLRADVSSQFTSGLLLSAPARPRGLTVHLEGPIVSEPYLDLTVAVMDGFGAVVDRPDDRTYAVTPTGYRAAHYRIEPDASAASYFFAAAAIVGGRVRVEGLGATSHQGDVAFVDVLEQMGAVVERGDTSLEVRGTGALRGVTVDLADLSDTAQTLAAVAVFADGPTEVTGIGFIRGKETDRIAAVVTELRRCGIDATETDDGFRIQPGDPQPAVVRTYDDHRMAMSFALLGLRAAGIRIADPGCVAKTFPGYWAALDGLRTPPPEGQ